MKRLIWGVTFLLCGLTTLIAQYGNEWIDYNKTYYKFKVAEDGVYRIPQATLASAGLSSAQGSQFRLYRLGEEVSIYTSTEGMFSGSDYIEFYGLKNRGEFDRMLFEDPDNEQLNPAYSMFTDSSAYFLTVDTPGGGKRIDQISNDLSNPPPAETYYMQKDFWVYTDRPLDPRNYEAETFISYSHFQEAEGYCTSDLNTFNLDIASTLVNTSGPDGEIRIRFASSNLEDHNILALFAADTLLNGGTPSNFHLYLLNKNIPANAISALMSLNLQDLVSTGTFAIASIEWTYPRQFDFSGKDVVRFTHEAVGAPQYFELNNFNHGGADPVVYDLNAGVRLYGSRNGNTVRFVLPAFTGARDIIVASQAGAIRQINDLSTRSFTDHSNDNTEYVIITNNSLRTGQDVVSAYAGYRSSAVGGGYHVDVYSISDISDQFGFGIDKHPQCIRNFSRMMRDKWNAIKMALIIGKGVVYTQSRLSGSLGEQNLLIPTFGNPGADNLLFTENGENLPSFPIGRLPVTTPEQIQIYLNKVKEYDQVTSLPQTIEDRAWTKEILHMGGGADAGQQTQILDFLNQMAANAENSEFGAHVTTFTKTSTSPTGESNSKLILDILHNGVSVVKFFGHSSASTLDFQVNNPADWQNKGKYPIFSAMGCRAGDIHQNSSSLSENFVFAPDAGPIAFLAGSGSQFQNTLGNWGKDWYLTFGHGVNTLTLGETIRNSMETLSHSTTLSSVLLVEQQTLTGDPAIRFYATPGPDYVWDYASLKHTPDILTVNDSSFVLSADVVNLGTNLPDTVLAHVDQKYPDGTLAEIFFDTVYLNGFRNQLDFTIPIGRKSSGLNTFYLTIDATNVTTELPDPAAEENNSLADASGTEGVDIFILDTRAKATYPQEFAIVTEEKPELIATSTNSFIKGSRFVMEIDTTAEFNSPIKEREYFEQFGGTLKWKPVMEFQPGTVYYWRVSIDSISAQHGYTWDASSFLYQPGGQRGWNQSHYYQYLRNDFDGLEVSSNRKFSFKSGVKNVWVQNAVNTGSVETFKFFVDNSNLPIFYRDWNSTMANVFVVVFDSVAGKVLQNPSGGAYGSENPFPTQKPLFPFRTDNAASRDSLMNFIENVIPFGYYVVLYTYQRTGNLDYYPEQWEADSLLYGKNIFSVIEHIYPASQVRKVRNGAVPYTLLFRKGYGAIQEQVAIDADATINADFNVPVLKTAGNMNSRTIGPAFKWHTLLWDSSGVDMPAMDKIAVSLYGLPTGGGDPVLLINVTTEVETDLSMIDAREYPYLYLTLATEDPSNLRTSIQLEYWRVLFEGKPELVYTPASTFMFYSDLLQLGDTLHFMSSVQNISPYPSEAMAVRYTITNKFNASREIRQSIPALAPGEVTVIALHEQISDTDGEHTFLAELDPDQTDGEVYHFNNFGLRNFYVIGDHVAPVLDVTFDGRHLQNGDVVSATPEISVTLYDENAFLPVSDPEHFELYLKSPAEFDFERIDLTTADISFTPSDPASKIFTASITWRPVFTEDGYYTFRAIAKDATGNQTHTAYEVTFEVEARPYILDVAVVPNPFYDQTRFTFVLTGHAAPSAFSLRITDATGRLVREFDQSELGNVYVGSHYSDIIWDGTDEGGAPVASGVYLYSIHAVAANGREYKYNLLHGDVGKILLLR